MRRSNAVMPCAKVGVLHPLHATHRPFLVTRRPFLVTRRPFLVTRRPCLAMQCPLRPMFRSFLAMPHLFAATMCEDVDAVHEESHGHRSLHSVLFVELTTQRQNRGSAVPFRGRGSECLAMHRPPLALNRSFLGMRRPFLAIP